MVQWSENEKMGEGVLHKNPNEITCSIWSGTVLVFQGDWISTRRKNVRTGMAGHSYIRKPN